MPIHDGAPRFHAPFTFAAQFLPRSHRWPSHLLREITMSDNKDANIVRIDLTTEQKEQVKAATEKSAEAIELTVQELEARIAPKVAF